MNIFMNIFLRCCTAADRVTRRNKVSWIFCLAAITPLLFSSPVTACEDHEAQTPKTHIVYIEEFEFSPQNISVQVGDKVRWINKDAAPHTATAKDESWNSGFMKNEAEWEMLITETTKSDYFCIYHPNMVGTLTIKGSRENQH